MNEFAVEEAKVKINEVLEEAFANKIITQEEMSAMCPDDKDAAKFYCYFKVHKETKHNNIPPVRPIISGSGAITEKISLYVEHHINESYLKHPYYLQDKLHFLDLIGEKMNQYLYQYLNNGKVISQKIIPLQQD